MQGSINGPEKLFNKRELGDERERGRSKLAAITNKGKKKRKGSLSKSPVTKKGGIHPNQRKDGGGRREDQNLH